MSKNKNKPKRAPVVPFQPVVVEPVPCTTEELDDHLRAFIEAFLTGDDRERSLRLLVDRRAAWFPMSSGRNGKMSNKFRDLFEFWSWTISRFSTRLEDEKAYPLEMARLYGEERGVYFDGNLACKLTAAEAASVTIANHHCGLLSFKPGRQAIFFEQDWESYRNGALVFNK